MMHQVLASYNHLGVAAVETPRKGGHRRQYLSWQDEQAFLAPFLSQAERGEIQWAFEAQVGHVSHKSTLSLLLKRHRGHKPVPRPVHPQTSAEAQAQFKKLPECC